jgi:hypothetical protein
MEIGVLAEKDVQSILSELATLVFPKHQSRNISHCPSCEDYQKKFTNYSIRPHNRCRFDRGVFVFYWGLSIICICDTRPDHFLTEIFDHRYDKENPTHTTFGSFDECLPSLKELTAKL